MISQISILIVLLTLNSVIAHEKNPRESSDIVTDIYNPAIDEFEVATIVPNIISLAPMKQCIITWDHVAVTKLGNFVHKNRMLSEPEVKFYGRVGNLYTLIMFHPDVPIGNKAFRKWHPWIVGNIPGCLVHKGEIIWPYQMYEEPKDAGIQRHVFLIYRQKKRIEFDQEDRYRYGKVWNFNITQFANKYDFDEPEFGNFLYSED